MSIGPIAHDPSARFAGTSPTALGRNTKQQHRFFAFCVAPSLAVEALKQAQAEAIQDLQKAGIKVDS